MESHLESQKTRIFQIEVLYVVSTVNTVDLHGLNKWGITIRR